jgi:hypothetical protein
MLVIGTLFERCFGKEYLVVFLVSFIKVIFLQLSAYIHVVVGAQHHVRDP